MPGKVRESKFEVVIGKREASNFLSTAEGKPNSDQEYDYLAPAGAGTRVYMLDNRSGYFPPGLARYSD